MAEAYELSFQERMEAGKDSALAQVESRAYLRGRVTYLRPKNESRCTAAVLLLLSTAEVAALWKVSLQQVSKVLARGGIPGARRSRKGQGKPWKIPAKRLPDGSLWVEAVRGQRGKTATYLVDIPL